MKHFIVRLLLFLVFVFICVPSVFSQGVGIGTSLPHASAKVDIQSSNSGILIPRLSTAQRKAIASPEMGLLVFDTDKKTFFFYDGQQWKGLDFSSGPYTKPVERYPADASADKWFGSSVAVHDKYAAIGAMQETAGAATRAGAVYIFERTDAGNWIQQAKITAPDATGYDRFGQSVDIDGDYLVVGAPGKTIGANIAQGKAYIYRFANGAWNLEAEILRAGGKQSDQFAADVAISSSSASGPVAVLGSYRSDVLSNNSRGQAIVYRRQAATNSWLLQQTITPAGGDNGDYFGYSVDLEGDYLVVGSPNHTYSGVYNRAGTVYVYVYGGGVWTLQKKIANLVVDCDFGYSVSLSGDQVAVGLPRYNNNNGRVMVFKRNGSDWAFAASVNLPLADNGSDRLFGAAVSLSGSYLLVGAPAYDISPQGGAEPGFTKNNGIAFLFAPQAGSSQYILKQQFEDPYPVTPNLYAQAVAISGNYYLLSHHLLPYNNMEEAGTVHFGSVE
jgi:hypothetical protein